MISRRRVLRLALSGRDGTRNPMPPPDIPPSIQKPQKSLPNSSFHLRNDGFGIEVRGPGDDGLNRTRGNSLWVDSPNACMSPRFSCDDDPVEQGDGLLPCLPLLPNGGGSARSPFPESDRHPVPSRHGPGSGSPAAAAVSGGATSSCVRDRMARQQTSTADAVLDIAPGAGHPLNELHAGPHAAGVLPPAPGPAEPFAQYRPRGNCPALTFRQGTREGLTSARWPSCRPL